MDILLDPAGFVTCGPHRWRCALGRGGVGVKCAEGDDISPIGSFSLGRVWWRADRLERPDTGLAAFELTQNLGWCDDPAHDDYNTLVTLPHPAGFEHLWRDDRAYDVVVEVAFNTNPIKPGLGSAIFIHVAQPNFSPTEGCIALELGDLLELLRDVNENSRLVISA